jgi:hypothetical protein
MIISKYELKIGDHVEIVDYSEYIPELYSGQVVELTDDFVYLQSKDHRHLKHKIDLKSKIKIFNFKCKDNKLSGLCIKGKGMEINTNDKVIVYDHKTNPPTELVGKIVLMDSDYIMVKVNDKTIAFSMYSLADESNTLSISTVPILKEKMYNNFLIWAQLQIITVCLIIAKFLNFGMFGSWNWYMITVPFWLPIVGYTVYWVFVFIYAVWLLGKIKND